MCVSLLTIFLFLSDGLHPSARSVPLRQHQDGEVPPAATGQRQQQNEGECPLLVVTQNCRNTDKSAIFLHQDKVLLKSGRVLNTVQVT